jgi:hypothetical protein
MNENSEPRTDDADGDATDSERDAIAAVQGWVASAPRSGRTWLRWLMASAIEREAGASGEIDWLSVYNVIPNDDISRPRKCYSRMPDFLRRTNRPRIVMTHMAHESFCDTDAAVVVLVRQPFDQIASNYHHSRASALKPDKMGTPFPDLTPDEFALAPGYGLDYYLSIYRGWAKEVECGHAHAVGYEQLKSDTAGTLLNVFEFLGVPMSEASARAASEYCTMSRMAQAEREQYYFILPSWDSDPNVRRIRTGQVGRGAAMFSRETILSMHRRLSAEADSLHDLLKVASGWTSESTAP